MYVNYYDRYVKRDFEKPTIGILLCKSKNDSLVELTLPKDANIYAAEYSLYLPDKKELQEKGEQQRELENKARKDSERKQRDKKQQDQPAVRVEEEPAVKKEEKRRDDDQPSGHGKEDVKKEEDNG